MGTLSGFLQDVELVLFVGLAISAIVQWNRRRTVAELWVAATFLTLGVVVLVGRLLPADPTSAVAEVVQRLLIALIALFPYFLFRFAATFKPPQKWIEIVAGVLTAVAACGTFPMHRIPQAGDPRSAIFNLYVALILVQWVFLSAVLTTSLWRGGRGEAAVTRWRMRTLSLGSVGITVALVVAGLSPSGSKNSAAQIVSQLFAILSAPLFLAGSAPPNVVLALWRRSDELKMRQATVELVRATSADEIAQCLLPHLVRVLGASYASLRDSGGALIGAYGTASLSPAGSTTMEIPMRSGQMSLEVGPYTPYFGQQTEDLARAIAGLADLSLERVRLTDSERKAAADLLAINAAMTNFVASASHDLRTPSQS